MHTLHTSYILEDVQFTYSLLLIYIYFYAKLGVSKKKKIFLIPKLVRLLNIDFYEISLMLVLK